VQANQAGSIRIGTRGSPLALWQAHETRRRLMAAHRLAEPAFDIVAIRTSGDLIQDRPLSEAGGKGLFTKELDEALLAQTIDLAVHSMKDLPTQLADGLAIAAVLPRGDVRDAFVSPRFASLEALPEGATLGTSSLRRQAQLKSLRPDLHVIGFRGNVDTRLKKLEAGVADATLLACAGLERLGLGHRITARLEPSTLLPAVAQGAIAILARDDDDETLGRLAPLDDQATRLCVTAERAFLAKLDGSCRTPIAGLAALAGGTLKLRGQVLSPDGRHVLDTEHSGPASSALIIGETAGDELIGRGAAHLFDGTA